MSLLPPAPPWPGVPGVDPLLGGSLSTGPTGLPPLAGRLAPLPPLPYASPLTYQAGGTLASQVPVGVGQQAATSALNLGANPAARGGLLSRLPSLPNLRPPAGAAPTALIPKGALLRGGMYGAAGSLGSGLIDQLNPGGQNSNLEQGLQGAAQGAGIGAGVGLLGGPFAGVTVPTGALLGGIAGGAIGVLGNMFGGGDDAPDVQPVQVLATAMTSGGLTPDQQEIVLQTYETQLALAESLDGDAKDAQQQAALEQAGQMILGLMQQNQQAQLQAPQQAANTLALQQQAMDIFEPLAQDIEANASLYAQAVSGIRDRLPESYRAVADVTAARELTSADKLANAYRAQAALTPVASALTQYQQDQSAYASQLFQQALAQQASGGMGAGNPNDLLAQLVPS